VKLVAGERQVIHRNLAHVNRDLAGRLHRVAVVQYAASAADFRNLLYRETTRPFRCSPTSATRQRSHP
jgi:hypothetical protein